MFYWCEVVYFTNQVHIRGTRVNKQKAVGFWTKFWRSLNWTEMVYAVTDWWNPRKLEFQWTGSFASPGVRGISRFCRYDSTDRFTVPNRLFPNIDWTKTDQCGKKLRGTGIDWKTVNYGKPPPKTCVVRCVSHDRGNNGSSVWANF